jgi:hypothetical protein
MEVAFIVGDEWYSCPSFVAEFRTPVLWQASTKLEINTGSDRSETDHPTAHIQVDSVGHIQLIRMGKLFEEQRSELQILK